MKQIIKKITNSTEWEVLGEMSKPKIILGAILFNVIGFISMYMFLYLKLFIHYNF